MRARNARVNGQGDRGGGGKLYADEVGVEEAHRFDKSY